MPNDIIANVIGAAIGGMISVSLAILMFRHERRVAAEDAKLEASKQRRAAIHESLRYVRAIRECVKGGQGVTINSSDRIVRSLKQASALARRALEDVALTDFPLRMSMEDAATIGQTVAAQLAQDVQTAGMDDANTVSPNAAAICQRALSSLDEIIDDYTKIRAHPALD